MNILVESVKDAFRKYFVLEGRATRPQFWYYVLAIFLIGVAFAILAAVFSKIAAVLVTLLLVVELLFVLAVIIPGITITVRRLRDAGFSGWLILIALVPVVGEIALLVMCALPTKN